MAEGLPPRQSLSQAALHGPAHTKTEAGLQTAPFHRDQTFPEADPGTPLSVAALLTRAKIWNPPKGPLTGECTSQTRGHLCDGIAHSQEKAAERVPSAAAGLERETLILSEGSQKGKDKCPRTSPVGGL